MKSPDGRECSALITDRKIVLDGRKTTKLYFLNPQQREVEKIEVDGCAITDGARCDWMLLLDDNTSREEIYVELKGSKVWRASEQLQATIKRLSKNQLKFSRRCFIVTSRNPMTGTDIQGLQKKFQKNFKADLFISRNNSEVSL